MDSAAKSLLAMSQTLKECLESDAQTKLQPTDIDSTIADLDWLKQRLNVYKTELGKQISVVEELVGNCQKLLDDATTKPAEMALKEEQKEDAENTAEPTDGEAKVDDTEVNETKVVEQKLAEEEAKRIKQLLEDYSDSVRQALETYATAAAQLHSDLGYVFETMKPVQTPQVDEATNVSTNNTEHNAVEKPAPTPAPTMAGKAKGVVAAGTIQNKTKKKPETIEAKKKPATTAKKPIKK